MSREIEQFVEEKVASKLSEHKEDLLKEMEGMFLKITAKSQSKLSNQLASSSLTTMKFRRKSNEEQYKANADVLNKLHEAETSLSTESFDETKQSISDAKEMLTHRQKMIKLADSSDLGWKVVSEYETNPLASDSDDEKRIYKAEVRASRKAKAEKTKKARSSRFSPFSRPTSTPARSRGADSVTSTLTPRRTLPGLCFACGKPGHWKGAAECTANVSNNKISIYTLFGRSIDINVHCSDTESVKGKLLCFKDKGTPEVQFKSNSDKSLSQEAYTDESKFHLDMSTSNQVFENGTQENNISTNEKVICSPVGKLRQCFSKWKLATSSEYIRNVVAKGYRLPLKTIPDRVVLKNNKSSRENSVFVVSEISSLLEKGVISEVSEIPYVVNPLTVAYGKSGKPRLVLDCRHINSCLHLFKVKFEDVKVAKEVFAENSFLFTFDLKSAYHHIDIFQEHRVYLGFSYIIGNETKYYQFNSLPFGIRTAGHIFTKMLKVVLAYIRSYGHRIVMFLDDGLGGHTNFDESVISSQFVKKTVTEFGFLLADDKCSWTPTRKVAWLGHVFDMVCNKIFISEKRMSSLALSINSIIQKIESNSDRIVLVRLLASVIGKIISLQSVVGSIARLKTRASFKCINARASWNAPVKVNSDVLAELVFWRDNANMLNKKGCHLKNMVIFEFCLYVDASACGYGGYLEQVGADIDTDAERSDDGHFPEVELRGISEKVYSQQREKLLTICKSPDEDTGKNISVQKKTSLNASGKEVVGSWSNKECLLSSTWREAEAVRRVLHAYENELRGSSVQVFSDNKNVKSVLQYGSCKPNLQDIALDTFSFCEDNSIKLHPDWIPREGNERADYLSRCQDSDDWEVSTIVFDYLDNMWGPHTVDRFASHLNTKCTRFNSRWWVPGTESVDCFSQNWSGEINWVVPPPRVIPECLEKISIEKAVCTVIVPKWKSAPFWPLLYGKDRFEFERYINLGKYRVLYKGRGNNGIFSLNPLPFDMLALRFQ